MKRIIIKLVYSVTALFPTLSLAQSLATGSNSTFKDFILNDVIGVIALLIPIMVALAFVVFFWGLSKFILHSDSQVDIQKGKNYMIWGVVVLFILVSFRAIISFISSDLGFGDSSIAPTLPTGGGATPSVSTGESYRFPTN